MPERGAREHGVAGRPRLLVTGGSGFVGSHLLAQAAAGSSLVDTERELLQEIGRGTRTRRNAWTTRWYRRAR